MLSIKPENTWAILIGTGQFEDKGLSDIPAVKNNLDKLTELFVRDDIIGIPEKHIIRLENEVNLYNKLATVMMERLPKSFDTLDTLIIYYVGHGLYHDSEVYLTATDTISNVPKTGLPFANLRELIDLKARNVLYVLDCCFSGMALKKLEKQVERVICGLAATLPTNKAKAPTDKSYTAFTENLIKLLEQGCGNERTLILATVYEELKKQLLKQKYPEPWYIDLSDNKPLHFAYNRAYKPDISFSLEQKSTLVNLLCQYQCIHDPVVFGEIKEQLEEQLRKKGLKFTNHDELRIQIYLMVSSCLTNKDTFSFFLEQIRLCTPKEELKSLEEFLETVGIIEEITPNSTDSAKFYLLIEIAESLQKPPHEDKKYRLQAWLADTAVCEFPESVYTNDSSLSLSEIPNLLPTIISKASGKAEKRKQNYDLVLEFFLPISLLCYPIEMLEYNHRNRPYGNRPYGTWFPVVVRSQERLQDLEWRESKKSWREHWNSSKLCNPLKNHLCRLNKPCQHRELYRKIKKFDQFGLIMPFVENEEPQEFFELAINEGVSIMLLGTQEELLKKVEDECKTLAELPDKIHDERGSLWGDSQEQRLVLFWDDYNRKPPEPNYELVDL